MVKVYAKNEGFLYNYVAQEEYHPDQIIFYRSGGWGLLEYNQNLTDDSDVFAVVDCLTEQEFNNRLD